MLFALDGGFSQSIVLNGFPANIGGDGVWWSEFNWSIMTIGATGTVAGQGSFTYTNPTVTDGLFGNGQVRASTTYDTTQDTTFDISGDWVTGDAANTITCEYATIELLNN